MIATTENHSAQNDSMHQVNNIAHEPVLGNKQNERTLAILTCSDQLETIIEYIKEHGFTVVISKQCQLTPSQAEEFYEKHRRNQSYFEKQVGWLGSTMICVMILEKENAIADWKKLMGPSNYKKAKKTHKESIRAVFGSKDTSQSATHGSETEEHATQEIEYFFSLPCSPENLPNTEEIITQKGIEITDENISKQDKVTEGHTVEETKDSINHDNIKEEGPNVQNTEESPVSTNKQEQEVTIGKVTQEPVTTPTNEEITQGTHENDEPETESGKDDTVKEASISAVEDLSSRLATSEPQSSVIETMPNTESDQANTNTKLETIDFKQETNEPGAKLDKRNPVTELEHVNEQTVDAEHKKEDSQLATTVAETMNDEPSDIIESYISSEPEQQETKENATADIAVESEASSTDDIKASSTNVSSSSSAANEVDNLKSSSIKTKPNTRQAALKKSDDAVEPSRSRIRPPSIIRDKKGVITPPLNDIPKPKVNRGTTRIARLSNNSNGEPEKKAPAKKTSVTKISKHLPRVATLSVKPPPQQRQQQPEEGEPEKKTKKRLSSTKSFITRLTAPTVASENKKAATAAATANDRSTTTKVKSR